MCERVYDGMHAPSGDVPLRPPFIESVVIFETLMADSSFSTNSCGNMPVVAQNVLSLPSHIDSGGKRSSWHDAITTCPPFSSLA